MLKRLYFCFQTIFFLVIFFSFFVLFQTKVLADLVCDQYHWRSAGYDTCDEQNEDCGDCSIFAPGQGEGQTCRNDSYNGSFCEEMGDSQPPYITSWGTYNTWTRSTTLSFTDSTSMSGGGVRCSFDSWPADSNPHDSSTTCTFNDAYRNGAGLYIRVWDGAGNQTTYNSGSYGVAYYLDNTAPYITSWGTYNAWTRSTTLSFGDGVSMNGGGVRCSFDGWPPDSNPGNSSTTCSFSDAYRNAAPMYIRVWDFLGNQVTYYSPSYGVYYYLDNTPPYITSWGTYNAWTKTTTLSFGDGVSMGGGGVRCSFDGWPPDSNPGNSSTTCSFSDAYRNAAPMYIRVWDFLGNQVTYYSPSYGVYYYLDNVPPTAPGIMTTSWYGDHWIPAGGFTASTSGSTDNVGVANYRLCRSNDNTSGCAAWVNGGATNGGSTTVTGADLPCNGCFRYYYWYAFDALGNQSTNSAGEYIRLDGIAPSHDSITVSNLWWGAGNNYDVTLKSTEAQTGIGGNYGMMALINYQGSNAGNYRGYFAWLPSGTPSPWGASVTEAVNCSGGGTASKYVGYGNTAISLVGCATSLSGNQRTTTFTVRPNTTFGNYSQINDISFYTTDFAGNAAGWTNFDINFGSDMAAPSATVITPEPSATAGTSNTVTTGVSTDTGGSGNVQYEFCMNTSGTTPPNGGSCNGTSSGLLSSPSYTYTGLLDNTTYYYWSRARDAAGNYTNWSGPTSSRQDSSAPTNIVMTSPSCGGSECSTSSSSPSNVSGTVALSTTATDPNCVSNCINHVEYWLNGGTLIGTSSTAPFTVSGSTAGMATGTYTVTVKVYDQAGNFSTKDYYLYIENTLPTITITGLSSSSSMSLKASNGIDWIKTSNNVGIGVTGTAIDTDSGLDSIHRGAEGRVFSAYSLSQIPTLNPNGTKTTYNWQKVFPDGQDTTPLNGTSIVSFYAKDKAGNWSTPKTTAIYVDKVVPVTPSATLTAGCGVSTYQWNYTLDVGNDSIQKNAEYITNSPTYQFVSGVASYRVQLIVKDSTGATKTVRDSSGNPIPTIRTFLHTAWVDGTTPPAANSESLSGLAAGDTVEYRINASDKLSNTTVDNIKTVTIASGVAPSVPTGLTPNSSTTWTNSATFSWTSVNNNTTTCNQGVSHQIRYRRVGDTAWTYATPSTSFPVNVSFPSDGSYEWQAQDTELFSNLSSGWSTTSSVQIDTTAPVVSYGSSPTVRDVAGNINTFRVGVTDQVPGSGLNGSLVTANPANGTAGSFGAFYFNPVTNQWVPVTSYRYQVGGTGPFTTVDSTTASPIGYNGVSDATFEFDIPLQIGGIYVDKYCTRVADRAGNLSSTWNCTSGFDTIIYDAGSSSSTGNTNASSLTWSHTTGVGNNKMLIVEVSLLGGNASNVTSVTYGGTPLTKIRRDSAGTDIGTELWYLANPASGTFDITVNTASPTSIVGGATTWFGVNPVLGASTGTFNTTANASPSLSISSIAGTVVVDVVGTKTKAPVPTPASGQILRWANESGFHDGAVSSKSGPTSAMNWTLPSTTGTQVSDFWAISAITLQPATTGAGSIQLINTSWFQVMGGSIHSNYGVDALPAPTGSGQFSYDQKLSLNGSNRTLNGGPGSVSIESYDSSGTTNALGKKTLTYPSYADLLQKLYTQSDPTVAKQTVASGQNIDQNFLNSLPSGDSVVRITGTAQVASPLTFSGTGGTRKSLVVLIEGTLTVSSTITVTGENTLIFITKGGINISDQPTIVDGYFISEGVINTAYNVATGTTTPQLTIHGGIAAIPLNGGDGTTDYLKLNRNLGATANSTQPGEKIIFEPKYYIWAQRTLGQSDYTWSEVAP